MLVVALAMQTMVQLLQVAQVVAELVIVMALQLKELMV
jgi:hypothetical protein